MSKNNFKDELPTAEECEKILSQQPNLSKQSFDLLKELNNITPLTKEIMSRQATLNIGTIGHVAHGKTTLVRAISGIQTTKHKIEKERNITYKLGYANAKLYKCSKCPAPECYKAFGSQKEDEVKCDKCGSPLELLRHISFVDCPGHDILMATMLNGAAVMDAALLLVAANEPCPQPQTSEHLAAVENMNLKNIIIIQNKIDIILKEELAKQHFTQIKKFVQMSTAKNSPIIPVSAQLQYNIDVVIEYLCNLPIPKRDFISPPRFIVVRSFDINKPGTEAPELNGGVAGGTLIRGILRLGEVVEIRPGLITKNANGENQVLPIYTRIKSLHAENNNLIYAIPGGLIGIGLGIDPFLTRGNKLVGKILGHPGKLPDIFVKILVKCHIFKRLLGVRGGGESHQKLIGDIKKQEVLLINVGSTAVGGKVIKIEGENNDEITFDLMTPVCAEIGEKIAISKKIKRSWRLIGWGEVLTGGQIIPSGSGK